MDHTDDEISPTPPASHHLKTEGFTVRKIWDFVSDIIYNAVVIIGAVALLRYFLAAPFEVSGSSMEPNLHDSEYIVVDKISYRFTEPSRGDIVVLIPPDNTELFYVKRIIGLPGEKIEFNSGQVIIHNAKNPAGIILDETYLSPENLKTMLPENQNKIIEIPENHYFVIGDNRNHSNDSRFWGTLHRRNIEGRAWIIAWPPSKMEILDSPQYPVS